MSDRLAAALAELVEAIREEARADVVDANAPDRLLSVAEARATLNIGHALIYDLIGSGRLRSIRVGRRRLIPATALADYIAGLAA